MSKKSFGSGYFGEWIEDKFGLPAYRYTCNQIEDPKAITPMNEVWHSKTDHWHQVGNDRLVAIVSNYGYIQVRQDEGGPKFLNVYDHKYNHFAGGFGYLTDGKIILSTYYSGQNSSFQRIFGIGYYRKKVVDKGYKLDQVIFAPFGDDPILCSQITLTNNRKMAVDLSWVEYWGTFMEQFSLLSYGTGLKEKNHSITKKLRRKFSNNFNHEYKVILNGKGLLESKQIKGVDKNSPKKSKVRKPSYDDKKPPATFLISLNGIANELSTKESIFFGNGNLEVPEGIITAFNSEESISKNGDAMFIKQTIHLNPSESQTLYFIYGYLPEGFELNSIFSKYKDIIDGLWQKSSESWKQNNMLFEVRDESWVKREILWHNYYLRSAMTFDTFFQEHILSQGLTYQYIIGFQGAVRDPLQHVKPFLFIQPEIVKEVLRYTLKEVRQDGEIPYGITGYGMTFDLIRSSDFELWLLWLVSEYVLITRDIKFLDEEIPTYPIYGRKAGRSTVLELLFRCYGHFTEINGTGPHGLQLLSGGDWNDTILLGLVPNDKLIDVRKNGESVLNSAMCIFTLNLYAEMLNFIGKNPEAKKVQSYVKNQSKAVLAQWTGKWFKRAWLTENIGWFGEDQIWLEPQPWAIIGEIPNQKQLKILVQNIDQLLRSPSKIGAILHNKGFKDRLLGMGANAGIWYSINGTLIWALSKVDGEMAWDEWKKNTLAFHAEIYPDIWYGIWSGPDTYNSVLSKYPGHTIFNPFYLTGDLKDQSEILTSTGINFTDFPIMNLHSHAWPLYNILHLIGLKFTKEGIEFSPILPKDKYSFSSPVIGFKKTEEGYTGWYFPLVKGNWKFVLNLNSEELKQFVRLEVNNSEIDFKINKNQIVFYGKSELNKALSWKLKKS